MRISNERRRDTEQRVRAAARAMLAGEIPAGGKADITTLARQARISRATLYRSYPHLKAEFEAPARRPHRRRPGERDCPRPTRRPHEQACRSAQLKGTAPPPLPGQTPPAQPIHVTCATPVTRSRIRKQTQRRHHNRSARTP